MNTWFECKAKYQKNDENGKIKTVSETYLIDAVSFTEAEERINKELEPYISGEFNITNIKIANYSELVPNDNGDRWFKCKVTFITVDQEKGTERRASTYMLVQANNVKEAYEMLEKSMSGTVSDYEIPMIQESSLLDVFKYFDNDDKNSENTQNTKKITNSVSDDDDDIYNQPAYDEDEDTDEEQDA